MVVELEKPKKRGRTKKVLSSESAVITKNVAGQSEKSYVVIDYPNEGDKFSSHYYTIRVGAGGGEAVEISIDGGEWISCRQNSGYFWFDWHSIPQGVHKIVARIKLVSGKFKKSKVVRCVTA